ADLDSCVTALSGRVVLYSTTNELARDLTVLEFSQRCRTPPGALAVIYREALQGIRRAFAASLIFCRTPPADARVRRRAGRPGSPGRGSAGRRTAGTEP